MPDYLGSPMNGVKSTLVPSNWLGHPPEWRDSKVILLSNDQVVDGRGNLYTDISNPALP